MLEFNYLLLSVSYVFFYIFETLHPRADRIIEDAAVLIRRPLGVLHVVDTPPARLPACPTPSANDERLITAIHASNSLVCTYV